MPRVQCFVRGTLGRNFRRVRMPGQVFAGAGRNAASSVHRRWAALPKQWRTCMPHRNQLRWKRTLGNRLRRLGISRADALFAGPHSAQILMHLRSRWWRESDEDDDAITARIPAKVDINIGFPVVDRPNVASLIDDHSRLTHHWDKTGESALTYNGSPLCSNTSLPAEGTAYPVAGDIGS